jgi:hypothetical protein
MVKTLCQLSRRSSTTESERVSNAWYAGGLCGGLIWLDGALGWWLFGSPLWRHLEVEFAHSQYCL